jgi:hypothetical protein
LFNMARQAASCRIESVGRSAGVFGRWWLSGSGKVEFLHMSFTCRCRKWGKSDIVCACELAREGALQLSYWLDITPSECLFLLPIPLWLFVHSSTPLDLLSQPATSPGPAIDHLQFYEIASSQYVFHIGLHAPKPNLLCTVPS